MKVLPSYDIINLMKKIVAILLISSIALFSYLYFKEKPKGFANDLIRKIEITPIPSPTPIILNGNRLFELINNWRVNKERLKPYIKDERLCEIANDRSKVELDYHKGLYEKYSNYPYVIQENVNVGYTTEEDSLNGWLNSPPHRATLEKPYLYSCVVCNKTCVQIFSLFSRDKNNPY